MHCTTNSERSTWQERPTLKGFRPSCRVRESGCKGVEEEEEEEEEKEEKEEKE